MSTLTLAQVSRVVRLCNGEGIDLLKAAVLSEIARRFSCAIHFICGDHHANARSVSELLCLMAEPGCEVLLEADGFESEEAMNLVEKLLAHQF